MVRLLVLDMLRRVAYWPLALLAFGFAMAWAFFPARGGNVAPVIAMSLAATYIIGPVAMLGWLGTPVVPYLPLSRRDLWRAAWVMGTVAPVALMAALKLPGTVAGGAGWSSLTLSSFMDLLFVGTGCVLVAGTNPHGDITRGGSGPSGFLLLLFGGIFVPFAVQRWLPTTWAEVSPVHAVAFGLGAALTTWGALQSPSGAWRRRPQRKATSSGPVGLAPQPGRLSGLPRLLAHELVWSGGMAITLLAAFLIVALVASGLSGSFTTFGHFVASQRLFVFDPASFTVMDHEDGIFGLLGWYALFVAAVSARFPEALRHLRVLPLGNATVHTLLMGWPVIVWAAIWALLMVLHVSFGQPIATLQIPLLLTLVAMSQFTQALRLRVSDRWFPIVFMGIPFARMVDSVPDWMLVGVWAIATVAAVALNVSALSKSDTYRRTNALALRMQRMS